MPDVAPKVEGDDSFVLGMDSYTQPGKLLPGEYASGMNIISRGGIAQTRPGSKSMFDMPSGNLQGCCLFTPASGIPNLVFAVDGLVYVSPSPFRTYFQLANIQFNISSKFISWTPCLKSTDFAANGDIIFIDNPFSILIIQDGLTRAAYWDGSASGHINPTKSNLPGSAPDRDGTVIGLWSCWSNNRLWVSRKNQIFASDIGNPLKFTEAQYLNEGRAFYLPAPCTGIVETSDRQGILCFTANTGTLIQSSIQDRTLWLTLPGFQQTILPTTGCVAPRSIVQQYGLIWWQNSKGLINQNNALQLNLSSRMDIQDNEMFQSKFDISYDLSGVCGTFYENFLLQAVPIGDRFNTRVHVLDQAPFEDNANSWAGFWTGWRPVEFARGVVSSEERVFCVSNDLDGVNRMWELFQMDKTDNGIPITSFVVTKQHYFGDRQWKRFRYAEVEMVNLQGGTAVMVAAAGTRGGFQPIMTKDVSATHGQVYATAQYGYNSSTLDGSRIQSRILRTEEAGAPSSCNEECVEYDKRGLIDKAFSIMVIWSGIGGVNCYRLFSQYEPEALQGICEDDETCEERLLSPCGCSAFDAFTDLSPFTTFYATAIFTRKHPVSGENVFKTVSELSLINQQDANRRAAKTAEWYVLNEIGEAF